MSAQPPVISEGGTGQPTSGAGGLSVPLGVHVDKLREADWQFHHERDRRYSEVAVEREKALEIKNEADKAALGLAREIQTYKDEKANELREQINSERGLYATKDDVAAAVDKVEGSIKPFTDWVVAQQGAGIANEKINNKSTQWWIAIVAGAFGLLGVSVSVVVSIGIAVALLLSQ